MINQALGKGLSSLISSDVKLNLKQGFDPELDINLIIANPFQPRKKMNDEKLKELSDSIKMNGVLSPIIVTRSKQNLNKYQLVAGERRLIGSKMAGLKTIPAIVRELSDENILKLALMENIQREDLTSLEEGEALLHLRDKFGFTGASLARELGLEERVVQLRIHLTELPLEVKEKLDEGILSAKHGYALGRIKDSKLIIEAMRIILKKRLSANETVEFVKKFNIQNPIKDNARNIKDAFNRKSYEIEGEFRSLIGTDYKVLLRRTFKGGSLIIRFRTDDELEELKKRFMTEG